MSQVWRRSSFRAAPRAVALRCPRTDAVAGAPAPADDSSRRHARHVQGRAAWRSVRAAPWLQGHVGALRALSECTTPAAVTGEVAAEPAATPSQAAASKEGGAGEGQEDAGKKEVFSDDMPPEVEELFVTLRDEALRRLDEFGTIHLFSLCWAYSTAGLLDDDLRRRITDAAVKLGQARDRESLEAPKTSVGEAAEGGSAQATEPDADSPASPRDASDLGAMPSVLVDNANWLALYKPPFWQVSVDSKEAARSAKMGPFEDEDDAEEDAAAEGSRKQKMQSWVRQSFPHNPISHDPVEAYGLLHRLDAQTSGILLYAKTYLGAYWLRLQWCSYAVEKEYICLAHGWVDRGLREIHKRIRIDKKKAPNSRRTISTHCSVHDSGKPSFTELVTLAHLEAATAEEDPDDTPPRRYSLVALKLHTGRTHQIRVHMLSLGHPLVCDIKYGEERFQEDRAWCPRNFLHTYRLSFADVPTAAEPSETRSNETSVIADIFCPLSEDLRNALRTLRPADDGISAPYVESWLSGDRSHLQPFEGYCSDFDAKPGEDAVP